MKILEVTQRFPPALGGVEIQVAALVRRLHEAGHAVEVATTDLRRDRPFGRLSPPFEEPGFPVRRHRAARLLPFPHGTGIVAPGLLVDLARAHPDVVHAHAFGYPPTWFAATARRLYGTPTIIETHADAGRGTSGGFAYARMMTALTVRASDRVVAHTTLEARLLATWGVPAERIVVLPNGIDLAEFEETRTPPPRVGGPRVLFVGRLYAEQKGLVPLVRAFARVRVEPPPVLRLVGEDWGGAGAVRQVAARLGVADRVEILGPLPRASVLEEFERASVFVLPSLFEPFGIVLLEAMASGVPVVASRVGGIPEVVEDGRTALLVPPNEPAPLAEAIERLLEERALAQAFGRAGRARAERFSWTTLFPRWVSLFEEVAQGRAR